MTAQLPSRERLEGIARGEKCYTHDDVVQVVRALLAAHEQEPVAKVVSKFGDPEAFGERELEVLVDIQKLPYNTLFYARPAPVPAVPECFINAVSALEALYRNGQKQCWGERYTTDMAYASGVLNACRAAMLNGGKS